MSNLQYNTYKAAWVANSFLSQARLEGVRDIDPLKIQKLTYCLHGWQLAIAGTPVVGEQFEAWPHGPVLSSLYHEFKSYRWNPIRDYAKDIDPATGSESASVVGSSDGAFWDIFSRVWNRYKGMSGSELSALTHAPGTPWTYARENRMQYIPNSLIEDHFRAIAGTGETTGATSQTAVAG